MEVAHKNLSSMVSHSFIRKLLPVLILFNVIIYAFEVATVFSDIGTIYYAFYALEAMIYGIFSTVYGYKILQWLSSSPILSGNTEIVTYKEDKIVTL
jgi:hypothetical protein